MCSLTAVCGGCVLVEKKKKKNSERKKFVNAKKSLYSMHMIYAHPAVHSWQFVGLPYETLNTYGSTNRKTLSDLKW